MKNPSTPMVAALLLVAGPAMAFVETPAALAPEPGEVHVLTLSAIGMQNYECRNDGESGRAGWTFVGPEARLFDAAGHNSGHHGAGPSWQADDGSRVEGTVRARTDAPVPGAIPWLLLSAHPGETPGRLARVTSIQRVNTTGGTAPASGCDADRSGQIAHVPYTADYHFYVRP